MVDKIIKDYIDNLKIIDVIKFANYKNINLNSDEAIIIHKYIVENWYILLHQDPTNLFNTLEKEIGKNLTDKVKSLYYEYFNKYKSYL